RLASLSPDPMYVVDVVEHRFLYVNDATVQLLGISQEKLMEPNAAFLLLERIHADDIPEVAKRYEKLGTEEEVPNEKFPEEGVSYRFLNTDGKWRWFESRETVFARSPEGGVTQLVGIARDIDDRKRAEEALYNSRDKLQQFIEHTPAPIAVLDNNLRYVAASRRWITDYRLKYDDITGMRHFDLFKKVPAEWKEVLYRCLGGAVERNDGAKLVRRNGEVQWIRWEVRPWHTPDKRIGGVIIFSEDITDRILAEEETRRNEEDLRYAQRLARVGSWSWNGPSLKTGYRYSEEIRRIYGLSADEKIPYFNEHKGSFYSEEEWERLREALETALNTGRSSELELEAIRTDGTPIWVNTRIEAVFNSNNQVVGLRGTVHDITERKRLDAERHQNQMRLMESRKTEEILLASQRRLQGIFDSVFGFIGLFTLDGVFVEINQTTLSFGGLKREEVVGKHLYDVVWFGKMNETREKLKKGFSRAAAGETLRFEFPIFLNEGKYITVDATFGPLRDETGKVVNVIGFGVDITERLNAQRELRESQTWLELALQTAKLGSWRYDLKTGIFTGDIYSRTMHGVADKESFDSFEATTKYLHPDDVPLIREKFENLIKEGGSLTGEYRVVEPGGTIKWIQS
ncbi:MAG: PAS domain S-box protein, partial [Planctomycetaceae bacterium]|nr:PAS domain S-box protein [Planctomycetaceae bacterium]